MRILKHFFLLTSVTALFLFIPIFVHGESDAPTINNESKNEYYRARVTKILGNTTNEDTEIPSYTSNVQNVRVIFTNGPEKNTEKEVMYFPKSADPDQKLNEDEDVFIMKTSDDFGATSYIVTDRYRNNALLWLTGIFILLVLFIGRGKSLGALFGLAFSFFIIIKIIVPWILAGKNPLLVCIGGSIAIALVSIYLAHGFSRRTSIAVISTMITIAIATGLDYFVIHFTKLFGAGSEEAVYAQFGSNGTINLRGLLLGGIIIGVLGVLDDITTAQSAVVDELHKANPKLGFAGLYKGGISVGKEHISSLVNTLVLAYVGASFPLILLFQQYSQPVAYILNSELVAEEIARALVGSTTLVLSVPLTTALAAFALSRKK